MKKGGKEKNKLPLKKNFTPTFNLSFFPSYLLCCVLHIKNTNMPSQSSIDPLHCCTTGPTLPSSFLMSSGASCLFPVRAAGPPDAPSFSAVCLSWRLLGYLAYFPYAPVVNCFTSSARPGALHGSSWCQGYQTVRAWRRRGYGDWSCNSEELARVEDQVNKTAVPRPLVANKPFIPAVRGQPHCKGIFLLSQL